MPDSSNETPAALTADEVETKIADIPDWAADMDVSTLSRVFEFRDFSQSMNFTNAVARLAEKHKHHPDMLISYKTVTLVLTTHDAGGLTDKDFLLASHIDSLPEAAGETHKSEPYLAG